MNAIAYDIKDPALADAGTNRIEWALTEMPVLRTTQGHEEFEEAKKEGVSFKTRLGPKAFLGNGRLSAIELKRIAIMASDGFARALRPVHTPFDGDIVFAVTTGRLSLGEQRQHELMRLGSIAADCLSRAIARGVYEARHIGAMRSYRDLFP